MACESFGGTQLRQRTLGRLAIVAIMALVAPVRVALPAADPVFSDAGPDANGYGAAQGYPAQRGGALLPQRYMVGTYSRNDQLYPFHLVAKPPAPSPLRRAAQEITLDYRYQGTTYSLDDYLKRNPTTGLLIARDDAILFEHYRYGRTDRDRLLSQSMAKTVTSMLLGIAVSEGAIRSIDQPAADYVPELAGSEYGKTTIRVLLHMASGVAFTEVYDGADDNAKLGRMRFGAGNPGAAKVLAQFNNREAPAATRFHYASSETQVLGLVIAKAVRMPLAEHLQSRIWQPMGAEADASWIVDAAGTEMASCCLNATLRDWVRFGLLLAHDGAWNGRQIIPRQWVLDATSVEAPYLAPGTATRTFGYGYQVWLRPGGRRQFALLGVHGQVTLVDPTAHLVLVHTAVRLKASNDPAAAEIYALWTALVARYGG
jgi:CubicO group peptidase (beta-lactamase class C family)